MKKKFDILSNEPEAGDLVCFAKNSELIVGQILSFNKDGYPVINVNGIGEIENLLEVFNDFVIIDEI